MYDGEREECVERGNESVFSKGGRKRKVSWKDEEDRQERDKGMKEKGRYDEKVKEEGDWSALEGRRRKGKRKCNGRKRER